MKPSIGLVIALIAATALAGCAAPPPPGPSGNPTSVTVTSAPSSAAANSEATVCWRVEGTGSIPHTAVHPDTTSHAGPGGTFADYRGEAAYPNNATAASTVTLPGNFCTAVDVGNETVYFRAHAMAAAPGILSDERRINISGIMLPPPTNTTGIVATVTFTGNVNATAPANSMVPVCWQLTGTGRIAHTAVHVNSTSHPLPTVTLADYNGTAYYPNNETAANPSGYDVPGTFCTAMRMPSSGTLYFRAHAIDSNGRHVFSPNERNIAVV